MSTVGKVFAPILFSLSRSLFSRGSPSRRSSEETFLLVCSPSDGVHSCAAPWQISTTVTRHCSSGVRGRRSRARHRFARNRVGANKRGLGVIGSVTPKGGRTTSPTEVCVPSEKSGSCRAGAVSDTRLYTGAHHSCARTWREEGTPRCQHSCCGEPRSSSALGPRCDGTTT